MKRENVLKINGTDRPAAGTRWRCTKFSVEDRRVPTSNTSAAQAPVPFTAAVTHTTVWASSQTAGVVAGPKAQSRRVWAQGRSAVPFRMELWKTPRHVKEVGCWTWEEGMSLLYTPA